MKFILALIAAMLVAGPAAAQWTETWRTVTGAANPGSLVTVLPATGTAHISVPAAANAGDDSPFIIVQARLGTTLCLDTDVATLAAAGNFVADIYWNVGAAATAVASVIIGTLSSGTPCLFDIPPGQINVECTTDATTLGEIRLQGNGS